MLKGIPSIISPELLKVLMEMGHGDELVIADGNFPGASIAASSGSKLVRLDGHGAVEVLRAILKLMPLDQYDSNNAGLMKVVEGDTVIPVIQDEYKELLKQDKNAGVFYLERFEYYERAKKAYAIVATGEKAQYANIILKKGCVIEE